MNNFKGIVFAFVFISKIVFAAEIESFNLTQNLDHSRLEFLIDSVQNENEVLGFEGATSVSIDPTSFVAFNLTQLTFKDRQEDVVAKAYQEFFTFATQVTLKNAEGETIGSIVEEQESKKKYKKSYLSIIDSEGQEFRGERVLSSSGKIAFYFKNANQQTAVRMEAAVTKDKKVQWKVSFIEEVKISPLLFAALAVFDSQNQMNQCYINVGVAVGAVVGVIVLAFVSYKLYKFYSAKRLLRIEKEKTLIAWEQEVEKVVEEIKNRKQEEERRTLVERTKLEEEERGRKIDENTERQEEEKPRETDKRTKRRKEKKRRLDELTQLIELEEHRLNEFREAEKPNRDTVTIERLQGLKDAINKGEEVGGGAVWIESIQFELSQLLKNQLNVERTFDREAKKILKDEIKAQIEILNEDFGRTKLSAYAVLREKGGIIAVLGPVMFDERFPELNEDTDIQIIDELIQRVRGAKNLIPKDDELSLTRSDLIKRLINQQIAEYRY